MIYFGGMITFYKEKVGINLLIKEKTISTQ